MGEEDEVDHQQLAVEVNDDDQSEQKDDIGDKQHFDEINHPFMVFLEKVLHKNPNTNKTLIQNAAQFWKVKLEHVDLLIKEKQNGATPLQSPSKKDEDEDVEENESEQEQDENDDIEQN